MRPIHCASRLALALCLASAAPARASRVSVDIGACRSMAGLMQAMRAGAPHDSVQSALERILDSSAYQVMFRHYNRSWRPHHLPPAVFERMILSLEFPGEYTLGENQRADSMLTRWRAAYADLPGVERQLRRLETARLPELIDRGVQYAQSWLPPGWTIPDFPLIVLPQGGSPAFAIDGAQGYDFFQIPATATGELDVDWLVGTIAHESNHLGMRGPALSLAVASDSVALELTAMCVAEGVATEFISGPPPGRVPAVPGVPYHIFTPALAAAWTARVEEEPAMMERMAQLLDRAVHGTLSQEQLEAEMRDYWFEGSIGRAYVFGSEMFGAIELALGRRAVFAAIEDPRKLFQLYDRAIDRKPEMLARCIRVPERTVEQSLAIGAAH
jgi:hypothetical protein